VVDLVKRLEPIDENDANLVKYTCLCFLNGTPASIFRDVLNEIKSKYDGDPSIVALVDKISVDDVGTLSDVQKKRLIRKLQPPQRSQSGGTSLCGRCYEWAVDNIVDLFGQGGSSSQASEFGSSGDEAVYTPNGGDVGLPAHQAGQHDGDNDSNLGDVGLPAQQAGQDDDMGSI